MEANKTPKTWHEPYSSCSTPFQRKIFSPHPDHQYIVALLHNDTVLIEELYKKHSEKIKVMILRNNGTEADAADIFQDALLSIYYKARTKNFALNCPLDAYLYLICKNRWINELSKRKHSKIKFVDTEIYEHIEDAYSREIEECRLQQERKDLLEEKLKNLSKSSQQLLRLCWSGKSMEEVAKTLNVSYGYARKKKSEAMAKLIKLLKQSPKYAALKW